MIRYRSLGKKLVILLIVVTVIPLGSFGGFVIMRSYSDSARRIVQKDLTSAGLIRDRIEQYFQNSQKQLLALTKMKMVSMMNRYQMQVSLKSAHQIMPTFKSLVILNHRGRMVGSSPATKWEPKKDYINEPFFSKAMRGMSVQIEQKRADNIASFPDVMLAFPIRNPSGEITGVAQGMLDFQKLEQALKTIKFQPEEQFLLINKDGNIIFQQGNPEIPSIKDYRSEEVGRRALAGQEGSLEYERKPFSLFSVYTYIESPDWGLIIQQPTAAAYASSRALIIPLLILLLFVIIFVPTLGWLLSRHTVHSIKSLVQAANGMADNDFDVDLIIRSNDEIGILARQFAGMRDAIWQQFEDLKEVDRLKDQFLANTSHELRTPLNGIIGIGESLLAGAAGSLNNQLERNLQLIVAGGRQLANLVEEILDLSEIQQRKIRIVKKPVDIRTITDLVLALTRPLVAIKPIELENELPFDLPLVHADEDRLQQILYNLIGNAIKFTAAGFVRVTAEQEGDWVYVSVMDTGIGIPKQKQEQIFRAFEQANGSIGRKFGGTGLGLYITKQLLDLHNGRLEVDSVPGRGSVFSFCLPISQEKEVPLTQETKPENVSRREQNLNKLKEEATQVEMKNEEEEGFIDQELLHKKEDQSQLQRPRILIVDDEPLNVQVLQNQMQLVGYQIRTAQDGFQALDVMGNWKPDLILLDLMMPRMSGYELCLRVRETYDYLDLPIVIITAKNQVEDLVRALDCGANDYISKPFYQEELLARIRTHVNLKHNQRLRIEKEAAEQSNRLKTEFLAKMSHEFRTPLHAILSFSTFGIKKGKNAKPEDLNRYFNRIKDSGAGLLRQVEDLLDYSKLETGHVQYHMREGNLRELVDHIIAELQGVADEKSIKTEIHGDEVPPNIIFDHERIGQVIRNLLANAIRHSPDNGTIIVNIHRNLNKDKDIIVSVEDEGEGVPEDELKAIFEKFVQSRQKKNNSKGTGLGLAISQKIVQAHQGSIWAANKKTGGAIFTFTLPINLKSEKTSRPA